MGPVIDPSLLWSVSTAEPLLIFSGTSTFGLDFSPDGRTLAVAEANQIKLFPVDLSLLGENPQALLTKFERAAGLTLKGFVLENMEPAEFAEALPVVVGIGGRSSKTDDP